MLRCVSVYVNLFVDICRWEGVCGKRVCVWKHVCACVWTGDVSVGVCLCACVGVCGRVGVSDCVLEGCL